MPRVLIASDAAWAREQVRAVLDDDIEVREVDDGSAVAPAAAEATPHLVVLDMQMKNMGGVAACVDLHLEASAGRLPLVPVLLLLDRRADVFLARRADADGWVVKPLDPIRLRRAVAELLAGRRYEDPSYRPVPVAVPRHSAATT